MILGNKQHIFLLMKHIIIIGARGFGRECYDLFAHKKGFRWKYKIKGFLDDKTDALEGMSGYPPIIGPVESYEVQKDDVFFCALGDPAQRKKYVDIVLKKGGDFISCISDYAIINPTAHIGNGAFVGAYAILSADVKVGDFSVIHPFCNLGHDAQVGLYGEIESYVALGGYSQIGDQATIHPHSSILPRIRVGNNAVVGAGSVVIKNVKEGTSVFGVPAKIVEF